MTAYYQSSSHLPHTLHPHGPCSMTYYQAELQWEVARRELRARLDALPSSSFARTMLEEDEVFYATFPEARRAAIDTWILSQQTPCPGLETYISGSGLQSYPLTPGIEFPADEHHAPVELSYPSNHIAHAPVRSPSPIYVDLNYDYHRADGELGESHFSTQCANTTYHSSFLRSSPENTPMVLLVNKHTVSSELHEQSRSLSLAPSSPGITEDDSEDDDNTTPLYSSLSRISHSPESIRSRPFQTSQYTGDWATDAIAAETQLYAPKPSYSMIPPVLIPRPAPIVEASHTHQHHLNYRQNKLTRSCSTPFSNPRSLSVVSDSPVRRRIKHARGHDGKPLMACLFCRGRKIACGPPSLDAPDRTCNQCSRRNLKCRYPLENRRGQRKKKDSEPQAKQIKPEPEISVPAFVCSANAKVKTEPTEPEDGSMSDDSEDSGSDWSEA